MSTSTKTMNEQIRIIIIVITILNYLNINNTLNRPSLVSRTGNAGWTERWVKEPKRKIKNTIKGIHSYWQ